MKALNKIPAPKNSLSFKEKMSTAVTEPFSSGRAASRLIFDFAVMAALLKPDMLKRPNLDFGAGSGWISEFLARMGLQATAFDIHGGLGECLSRRAEADCRIEASLLSYVHGDGHSMPFEENFFGHVLCFDSLHHMHDYPKVFSEIFKVLCNGGRAIFVEPGAGHSTSSETLAFVEEQKKHDPTWIERDVVLDEIDGIARSAGFKNGLVIVPMFHPHALMTYSISEWKKFRKRGILKRKEMTDHLAKLNYWDRVIFYLDK